MMLKRLSLFVITCFVSAALGIVGHIFGTTFSWIGSWAGYLVGSAFGVGLAVWIAVRSKLIDRTSLIFTLIAGWAGLECGVSALFYIHSLPWPIIPLLSLSAVG